MSTTRTSGRGHVDFFSDLPRSRTGGPRDHMGENIEISIAPRCNVYRQCRGCTVTDVQAFGAACPVRVSEAPECRMDRTPGQLFWSVVPLAE